MPRTTTLERPGCPPLRALTFDELGLIKVIEARGKQGRAEPKLVERWGDLDSSKSVLAASLDDRKSDPNAAEVLTGELQLPQKHSRNHQNPEMSDKSSSRERYRLPKHEKS